MISAQNRPQRSNGSKFSRLILLFVLFAATLMLLPSCEGLKKVPKDQRRDKDLGEIEGKKPGRKDKDSGFDYGDNKNKVDTMEWEEVSETDYPPIAEEGKKVEAEKPDKKKRKSSYSITYMLPFLTDRFNGLDPAIDEKSMVAIHFYEGVKMALDNLRSSGLYLDVHVLDTKASYREVSSLLTRQEVKDADIIIGPWRSQNIRPVAQFAKENEIALLSPASPREDIVAENPYYIQVMPTLRSHCEAITHHVRERYNIEQVVLVCRNKDAEIQRFKYFQDANAVLEDDAAAPKFQEFIVPGNSNSDYQEIDLKPYIKQGETTVFVVPSYSNESFVYSFLRNLSLHRGNNNVVVYGMPQWMDYELISYDYFENLNVHISRAGFVNTKDFNTKDFRRRFFERYGIPPTQDAFQGYDITTMLGDILLKHGADFIDNLNMEEKQYLHTAYQFERVPIPDISDAQLKRFKQYENKHVDILKFENYYYQLAK